MLNSRNKKDKKEQADTASLNTISAETTMKGVFVSSSDTRIGGSLEGDLKIDGNIFLTERGSVEGTIRGNTVAIAGSVKGDVNATQKVFLASTAKVYGSICAEHLVIEEGAIFNGDCKMGMKPNNPSSGSIPPSDGKNKQLAKKSA